MPAGQQTASLRNGTSVPGFKNEGRDTSGRGLDGSPVVGMTGNGGGASRFVDSSVVRSLLSAVAFTLVLLGAPAVAGAELITVRDSTPIPGEQGPTATATATCPPGTNVVSGGWEATAGVTSATESRRVGMRSWRVTVVRATNDLAPATLKTFAYCDDRARRLDGATALLGSDAEDKPTGVSVPCPAGERAVSGGFQLLGSNPYTGVIQGLFRATQRAWRVNYDPGYDISTARAFAYCAKTRRTRKRSADTTASAYEATIRSPRCPGTRAGGFRTSVSGGVNPMTVDRFKRRGQRWLVHAWDVDNAGLPLTAFAYCPRR